MSASEALFTHWYYHLPNYALALVMYTMIGRLLLMFVIPPESKNYIWRSFVMITQPVVDGVSFITPRAAPPLILLVFCVVWLFVARIVFFAVMAQAGLVPTVAR